MWHRGSIGRLARGHWGSHSTRQCHPLPALASLARVLLAFYLPPDTHFISVASDPLPAASAYLCCIINRVYSVVVYVGVVEQRAHGLK